MTTDIPTLALDDLDREELLFVIRRAQRVSPEHMSVLMSPADLWDARAEREGRKSFAALTSTIDIIKDQSAIDDALQPLYLAGGVLTKHRRRVRELEARQDKARAAYARAKKAYERHGEAEGAARANARRLREAGR